MSWLRIFRRRRWDRERREEIESYLEMEARDRMSRGVPETEARMWARRKLGNQLLIREEIYRMNSIASLDALGRDLRRGLRMLRRNPVFTAVALVTLATGIGASTAVFSVVNSIMLRPLRYPDSERLVAVWNAAPGAPGLASVSGGLRLSPSMYFTYAENNRAFQSLGVWNGGTATVTGLAEPEQVRAAYVSDGLLQALAVPPAAGRWLLAGDQAPGAPQTVMVGHGYWQRRFGSEASAVGAKILVESRPREIVGVMPAGFRIGNFEPDLIVPLQFDRGKLILAGFGMEGIARLKPGVTIAQANADLARMLPIWMDSWTNGAGTNAHWYEQWRITPAIRPLKREVIGNIGNVLWVLMGTIGLVMLIVCANVANLLLVRAEMRRKELAVRAALGAGWGEIVRQLLAESVLLALLGGAMGVGVAYGGLRLLVSIGPANLPRLGEIGIDGRALAFTLAISFFSGVMFGLIPAWKYAGRRIAAGIGSAGRAMTESRERHRTRSVLVVSQVALALVLLVCSGLMIRTFHALRTVDPGFSNPEDIQTLRISIPAEIAPEPQRVARMQNDIVERLAGIPGVASVAFVDVAPMEEAQAGWDEIRAEDKPEQAGRPQPLRMFRSISPGFFQTMGTRIVAGRDVTWTELHARRPVVLVSENLARELWGSAAAAVGKRVRPGGPWREVIGVVQDVRENGVQQAAPTMVYWPIIVEKLYPDEPLLVMRTVTVTIRSKRAGSENFLAQVRNAVWSVNASVPVAATRTMQEIVDRSMARTSFTLVMLAIAGAIALILGIVGIYGVISYAVSQRRREIGIRLALGAQTGELQKMFVRHGLMLAGIGAAIGAAAAMGLTRLIASLLFGIGPMDPLTYAAAAVLLALAAILASALPARRAATVDPVEALRSE